MPLKVINIIVIIISFIVITTNYSFSKIIRFFNCLKINSFVVINSLLIINFTSVFNLIILILYRHSLY